ncbi:anhydro-N-acetylmuramic acid kinase [Sphingobacterium alkalisoli]|uniref:Anhydro-N-acetylmuramic acid kinase n=1 Tax=Sphingobacterium alkalisoli TaxID=1874115 RepID=A0A4U0H7Y7_9SPHI|nr:anhydro-N-acetylmuramic acid kinase [Sphingobacterium alkalisoli]TJY67891.1 anhydro-N-acetylmuramic acid kinase [Sphingobacterium alkalisoli]GGH10647.1 anhydro-N-acetylmuramic acid kinase [Sphingobacterium alkalisoli]
MNAQIQQLYNIGSKSDRLIIGLMSGTSLDGLDIALCRIQNSGIKTRLELLHFATLDYTADFRNKVRRVFAKREIDQQTLCGLNSFIGMEHARLIQRALNKWQIEPAQIDLIASHGQTVYHAPQILTKDLSLPNSTLQIGDGDHIAVHTGIITISDFRQKHIAAGGEGAPLAAYGDYLLFTDDVENRILLNIGGISNFTFLPHTGSDLQSFATDLGPGNTMMNQYVATYYGIEMDTHGEIAKQGTVHRELLSALLAEEFLQQDFPKTTGPELFNLQYLKQIQQQTNTSSLSHPDVLATLNAFSAKAITQGIQKVTKGLQQIAVYMSGGGIHNPLLIENIRQDLPSVKIESMQQLNMDPDAKEACLFALLANETVAGSPENFNNIKNSPAVCMGKISFPS